MLARLLYTEGLIGAACTKLMEPRFAFKKYLLILVLL